MSNTTILGQVFGLFFTVLGLGFIFNREHVRQVMTAITENHAIQLVAAIVPLLVGSYVIVVHNVWVANWSVLVTVVGWLIFLAGVFRMVFPAFWVARIRQVQQTVPVVAIGVVMLVLGVVLLYFSFMMTTVVS